MSELNGKVISHILQTKNITVKEAADKIGISYNNLSSILNNRSSSTPKTEEKIKDWFLNELNINSDELYKKTDSDFLFRLRLIKQPSKNEIAIVREDVVQLEKIIELLDFTDQNFSMFDDYIDESLFDIYTWPYKDYDLFCWSQKVYQLYEFLGNKKIKTAKDAFTFLSSEEVDEMLFENHLLDEIGSDRLVVSFAEKLGIKIILINLHSSKIFSASTPFFNKKNDSKGPIIFINKSVCKSPEKILHCIAKELFYILFIKNEYTLISDYTIEIENENCEGNLFAKELLFNHSVFNSFLKDKDKELTQYFPRSDNKIYFTLDKHSEDAWVYLICELKKYFRVSYKEIISYFYKINYKNIKIICSKEDFCNFFITAINRYNLHFSEPAYKFINDEPQVQALFLSDHFRICLNCLINHKDDNDKFKQIYNDYESYIKEYLSSL